MSFVYEKAITKVVGATNLASADVRVLLVGASTTADTETEIEFLSGFTTLDEISATNYARKTVASEAINEDLTNNRAEFDFEDQTWSSLGGASNDTIQGAVVYVHVTDDTDSWPLCYLDDNGSSFNKTTNGSDMVLTLNAQGVIQFTAA